MLREEHSRLQLDEERPRLLCEQQGPEKSLMRQDPGRLHRVLNVWDHLDVRRELDVGRCVRRRWHCFLGKHGGLGKGARRYQERDQKSGKLHV
ncbi:MAG: hypothetical protein ACK56I_27525, partial [bacterium]